VAAGAARLLAGRFCELDPVPASLGHAASQALLEKILHILISNPAFVGEEGKPASAGGVEEEDSAASEWCKQLNASVEYTPDTILAQRAALEGLDIPAILTHILRGSYAVGEYYKIRAPQDVPSSPAGTTIEYRDVVTYGTRLAVSLLVGDSGAMGVLLDYPGLRGWVTSLLLETPDRRVREEVARMLVGLTLHQAGGEEADHGSANRAKEVLRRLLLESLPEIESHADTCEQYFGLLERLISTPEESVDGGGADERRVIEVLATLVQKHESTEVDAALDSGDAGPGSFYATGPPSRAESNRVAEPERVDDVLVGALSLLTSAVQGSRALQHMVGQDSGLLAYVFHEGLFERGGSDDGSALPKCKARKSRKAALEFLLALVADNEANFAQLLALLRGQLAVELNREHRSVRWNYVGEPGRSAAGFVGLQNMGATCYMNSLMQQLYNVPRFRELMMHPPRMEYPSAPVQVVYHLQKMFVHLTHSLKRSYDPASFLVSIPGYNDQPLDPGVQWDANEFFNMLFDRLETCLKATREESFLRQEFGGLFRHQLLCLDCPHTSEREEPFYTMGISVKNKKNIIESLELFVEGELLAGDNAYFCDKCEKKVDTKKRCAVLTPPTMLLLNLKRMEFDYHLMDNVKINDECAFPHEFDLAPFTIAGLTRDEGGDLDPLRAEPDGEWITRPEHRYRLRGIVIHVGTAERGHYYSFIDVGGIRGESPRWLRFDDTRVVKFDPADIPREAFGGEESIQVFDRKTRKHKKIMQARPYNAYLLIYEHVEAPARRQQLKDLRSSAAPVASPSPSGNDSLEALMESVEVDLTEVDPVTPPVAAGNGDDDSAMGVATTPLTSDASEGKGPDSAERTTGSAAVTEPGGQGVPANGNSGDDAESVDEKPVKPDGEKGGAAADGTLTPATGTAKKQKRSKGKEEAASEGGAGEDTEDLSADETGDDKEMVDEEVVVEGLALPSPAAIVARHAARDRLDVANPPTFEELVQQVREGNDVFVREKNMFDVDYFIFVQALLQKELEHSGRGGRAVEHRLAEVATYAVQFFAEIFCRASVRPQFDLWVGLLSGYLQASQSASRYFLGYFAHDKNKCFDVLVNGGESTTRLAFVTLFTTACHTLAPGEAPLYVAEEEVVWAKREEARGRMAKEQRKPTRRLLEEEMKDHKSVVIWFMSTVLALFADLKGRRNSTMIKQYFILLTNFAKLGPEEKRYLLRNEMVGRMTNFFLRRGEFKTPSFDKLPGGVQPGFKSVAPGEVAKARVYVPSTEHLAYLVETVAVLVEGCVHPSQPLSKPGDLRLPSVDRDLLIDKHFIPAVVGENVGIPHVERIMLHLARDSKAFSKLFIFILRDGILRAAKDPKPYMRLLCAIQDLEDGLQEWRVDASLLECLRVIRRSKRSVNAEMEYFLNGRAKQNAHVQKWLDRHIDIIPPHYLSRKDYGEE